MICNLCRLDCFNCNILQNRSTVEHTRLKKAFLPFVDYHKCKKHYNESDFTEYSFCTSKEGEGPCDVSF